MFAIYSFLDCHNMRLTKTNTGNTFFDLPTTNNTSKASFSTCTRLQTPGLVSPLWRAGWSQVENNRVTGPGVSLRHTPDRLATHDSGAVKGSTPFQDFKTLKNTLSVFVLVGRVLQQYRNDQMANMLKYRKLQRVCPLNP